MAGSSMKDIQRRIKSVESTKQTTKAMELVASSKLIKAKARIENSRPYFSIMHQTLADIAYSNTDFSSPFVMKREVKKSLYVMIAGDRGLAGGYNSNLFKKVVAEIGSKNACVLPIGKKALDFCKNKGLEIYTDKFFIADEITVSNCFKIAKLIANSFLKNEFDEVYIGYTNFVSMLSQEATVIKVLPINYNHEIAETPKGAKALIIYEPDSETVYNSIVPNYMAGMLYGSLCESLASELSARRTAMDSASKNATEMIEKLSLKYNRARQSAITQEISEIVAGAEN